MAGQLTIDTLKTSSGVFGTQNAIGGIATAWINYNGVARTIRGSFNVSSVTVPTAGRYQINFTTAMPDANYSIVATSDDTANNGSLVTLQGSSSPTYTTTYCIVQSISNQTPASLTDSYTVSVVVNR